ncbi:hypothetical protein K493DRAFT_317648 [Basidiobolus meristosporus CBS 931.73]|uniref:Uncharacterized protein n=1 Tax=Basidiobolus meristosporus CBS 931.73 TaxID=1314790 RepID=A0A1Y1XYV9_9FUNG|nr:hypothetical protein K493DRAFT_317648 [Basidiobolus meristosporus CBS 931.73]|eukprot:ORX90919.1 hypothetical protein K493DRAFT_317648 [Basidiobolus meristosporus CBS 931.73]
MSRPNIFIFVYVVAGVVAVASLMAFITFIHRYCKSSPQKAREQTHCTEDIEIHQGVLRSLDARQNSDGNTVVILPFWVDHDTNNATFIQSFIIDSSASASAGSQLERSSEDPETDLPLPLYTAEELPPAYNLARQNEASHPLELTAATPTQSPDSAR